MTIITGRRGAEASEPEIEVVPGWGFGSIGEIARRIGELQPDVVHLQYQTAAFGMSGAVCLLPYAVRTRRGRPRFITTFHDLRVPYLFPKAGVLRRLPARVLLGASDGCIFTNQGDLMSARPRGRAVWIPIGPGVVPAGRPNRAAARDRLHIDADAFVIAYFGFMNSSKGVETLLAAAQHLTRTRPDFRLLFLGADQGVSDPTNMATAADVRYLASQLGLESHIVETGWLPAPDLSRVLAAADVAALPYADGASLRRSSLVTCLAHGVPVVTTAPARRGHATSEHLIAPFDHPDDFRIDEDVAALIAPGDAAALADQLRHLADDAGRRKALARSGRQLARRLTWPSIGGATASFYRSIVGAAA